MRPRVVLFAIGAVALAIAAWQLMRSLDDDADPTHAAAPSPSTTRTQRTPIAPPAKMFATVRGTVRDEAGKPIANARVCGTLDRCTSTTNDGAYELADLPATTVRISAAAPTFQPHMEWLRGLADGDVRTIDLVLASGGVRVHGHVRDPYGTPIAGAVLAEAVTEGVDTTTRADGAFEMWVAIGPHQLFARATGHASRFERVLAPAEIEITLAPESTIAGVVTGPAVSGVRISVGDDGSVPLQRVTTGDDGTFRLVGLPAGTHELRAHGFGLAGHASISIGVGEHLGNATIEVSAAFQVGVHVKRADGTPCPDGNASLADRGASIGIARKQANGSVIDGVPAGTYEVSVACPPAFSTETLDVKDDVDVTYAVRDQPQTGTLRITVDAPGRIPGEGDGLSISIRGEHFGHNVTVPGNHIVTDTVPPGTYRLRVRSTSTEGTEESVTVRVNETTEKVMRIAAPTMGRLRATAVDADGRTVTDVALVISGPEQRTVRTLADGSVSMFLPGGDYAVTHGGTSIPAHVTNGASRDVRVIVSPTAIVRGVVVDIAGRPVTDALVARINPQVFSDQTRVDSRPVDASGAFRFPMMTKTPILLVATRVGGGESPLVHADGKTPVKLVIGGGATLTGTVVSATGARAPRFALAIADTTRNVDLGERSFVNGELTWSSLDPGEYRVTATANVLVARGKLTIAAGARTATIALTLPATFTLAGRVIDAVSREPIANAKVRIRYDVDDTASGGSAGSEQTARMTDATGRFSFADAAAATYQLDIAADAKHLATSQTVIVTDANVDTEIAVARARN